jgi:hypothetical protein
MKHLIEKGDNDNYKQNTRKLPNRCEVLILVHKRGRKAPKKADVCTSRSLKILKPTGYFMYHKV